MKNAIMCPYTENCKLLAMKDYPNFEYLQCNLHGCRYTLRGEYIPYGVEIEDERS